VRKSSSVIIIASHGLCLGAKKKIVIDEIVF
jgi:hypothetical protein